MVSGDLGRYEEAEALHRHVLDARVQSHGTSSLLTASARSNVGTLLSMTGKTLEAEMARSQTFRIRREQLGESHPVTVDSMINIAACLHSLGYVRGGHLYLAEALKHRKLGPTESSLIAAKSDRNLGYLLSCYGRLAEAVPFLRRALAVREERLGRLHPYTEWTQELLGDLLIELGELEEGTQRLTRL
jgi:tetratricopeptide (TPR) repeat protein